MAAWKVVEIRGIPIHYEAYGEGRPSLWIHGVVTDRRHMVAETEPVFERRVGSTRWRRIYPDLPGRGETPGADWIQSQDDVLDITLEFLDAVAPNERFTVGGTSWGGYLTMGVLHRRAAMVDGAAFIVANPLRTGRAPAQHKVLMRDPDIESMLVSDSDRDWFEGAVVQTREALEADRATIAPSVAAADMPFLERVEERTNFSFDVKALAQFDKPTVVMSARQDSTAGYTDMLSMLETFPRATWAILDVSGHMLPVDRKFLFESLLSDWLDRVEYDIDHPG